MAELYRYPMQSEYGGSVATVNSDAPCAPLSLLFDDGSRWAALVDDDLYGPEPPAPTVHATTANATSAPLTFYTNLSILMQHLPYLGLALVSVVIDGSGNASVTLSGPCPQAQLSHLGLSTA